MGVAVHPEPPRQRASRRHQPALPQPCVSPTPPPTSSIPIALKVPATPEHSAVSSIGICTTPARMRLWPALMSVVEGRHPTNLNTSRQTARGSPCRLSAQDPPVPDYRIRSAPGLPSYLPNVSRLVCRLPISRTPACLYLVRALNTQTHSPLIFLGYGCAGETVTGYSRG